MLPDTTGGKVALAAVALVLILLIPGPVDEIVALLLYVLFHDRHKPASD